MIKSAAGRKMWWLRWYPTRADIRTLMAILFLIAMMGSAYVFVLSHPTFRFANGFGPDWDCNLGAKGICIKRLSR